MELQEIKAINKLEKWFGKNWEFVGMLMLFSLYMFLGNFFMWGQAFLDGLANFSGGSDPYFNYIFIQYILSHHQSLLYTYNLNYPIGSRNPRNPFFHWMIAFVSTITAPIFGSASKAAYYSFMEFDAVFGALLIVPVYLLGKSILGKKAGMIAAILYTLMPSNLTSGILSDGRMHTPELIFAFFTIYFIERSVKYLSKERIIKGSLSNYKSYLPDTLEYIIENKKGTIYALLAAASFGALALSWQGYAYILAIVAIYVVIQLLVNLFLGRNNGYILYLSAIFVVLSFAMAYYYYYAADNTPSLWYIPPLMIGVVMILISLLIAIFGRKPWIISVPALIVSVSAVLLAAYFLTPHIFDEIISGEGYFIKNRVYSTIAEAQAPALGQYIAGFGVAQFIFGIGGFAYIIYRFVRERTDSLLLLIIFSGVSIYMSFSAARFNVTAAPSYAIMGGALIYYFASILKVDNIGSSSIQKKSFRRVGGLKGNIKWLQTLFVILLVFALLIPSGLGVVSTAVPANSAVQVNKEIYNALPSFAKPSTFQENQSAYFGTVGSFITNSSSPLSQSFAWFSTQQSNLPISERPAYVDWWDYGFQELYQGQHPTVADDFQQAYQIAGQILLSTNESQIIALMTSRLIQASFIDNSGHYSPALKSAMSQYLSNNEMSLIEQIYDNPHEFVPWIIDNSSVYGVFIKNISNTNAYYALVKGQLTSKLSLSQLVNLYQAVQKATGWSIQYIQTDHNLFPLSGLDTGIFYAPAYLTDTPSYTTEGGGVVPYEYYQIYAVTPNGTFPLNQTPTNVVPTNYEITYTPAFYNTTIYRALVGLPPTAVGQTSGVPGLTFGTNQYEIEPAWNMSNFEVCYEGIPYNPYQNASAHQSAFKIIPLQQAYSLERQNKGTSVIFPSAASIIQGSDPILRYFPGAIITGQIKSPTGVPISGIRVTILDQYGIPHQTVLTNKYGYYNLTGLPGNDTLVFSDGTLNQRTLYGANILKALPVIISRAQAERKAIGLNQTTGLPQYYIVKNYVISNVTSSGFVTIERQLGVGSHSYNSTKLLNGTVQLTRISNGQVYNFTFTNGEYNASNIGPGNYSVNVVTSNGIVYKDIQDNVLTPGSPIIYDIKIPLDLIQTKVTMNGIPIGNAKIIVGNETYYTNNSGMTYIYTNSGNYTLYAKYGNSISSSSKVSFQKLGENTTVNLSLVPGAMVNITVNNFEAKSLDVYKNGELSSPVSLSWNGKSYSGILGSGYYVVYDTYKNQTVFSSINVYESSSFSLAAHLSRNVKVIPYGINLTAFTGTSVVFNNGTEIYNSFSGAGPISYNLPSNLSYGFYIQGVKVGVNYFASEVYNVAQNSTLVMDLEKGSAVSVGVYNPAIAGIFSSSSAASNGAVFLFQYSKPLAVSKISSSGYATFILGTDTSDLMAKAYSDGFSTNLTSVGKNSQIPLNVVYSKVTINFESINGGAPLDGILNLTSSTSFKENVVNGTTSFTIPVGTYYVKIDSGNQIVLANLSLLTFTSTQKTLNISFVSKIHLSVINSVKYYLFNQTSDFTMPISNSSFVSPGYYELYTVNSVGNANISMIHLTANITVFPVYTKAYDINITYTSNISGGDIYISNQIGKFILNTSNLILPEGSYTISYENRISNSTGEYYLSTSADTIYLNRNTTLLLSVNSEKIQTTVNGLVTYDSVAVPAANVSVFENGTLIATANTNDEGQFHLYLSNGNFTVYSYNKNMKLASLSTLSVGYFQSSSNISIGLKNAYQTYVYTSIGKKLIMSSVNVTSSSESITVISNGKALLLPLGNYTFQSYTSTSFKVGNFSFYQKFTGSITEYVNQTSYVQIILAKELIGSVNLTQSIIPKYNETNGYVNVNFTLKNMLNTPINLTISSGSSSWRINFNKTKISNFEIDQSINISANLSAKNLVPGGINNIPIKLSYNGYSSIDNLKVNVTDFYGVNLAIKNTMLGFNNGNGSISLIFKNTGNVNETVNFSTPNNVNINGTYVNLSLLHVNVTFIGSNGKQIREINLSFNQSYTVYLNVIPQKDFSSSQFTKFDISYELRQTNTSRLATVYVQYPDISNLYNYVHGPGIIDNYTGNPISTLEYGIIFLVIVVLVGFVAIAIKGRKVK
ncbi:hypothetical protein ACNF42_06095 [Cuniculiplasma sp. SKW3]|uniref:hypothetical protein n=1 Tax=Cuniculiplasma sp. SKW3 TaxID=3400170 RepID=UPI003FD014DC